MNKRKYAPVLVVILLSLMGLLFLDKNIEIFYTLDALVFIILTVTLIYSFKVLTKKDGSSDNIFNLYPESKTRVQSLTTASIIGAISVSAIPIIILFLTGKGIIFRNWEGMGAIAASGILSIIVSYVWLGSNLLFFFHGLVAEINKLSKAEPERKKEIANGLGAYLKAFRWLGLILIAPPLVIICIVLGNLIIKPIQLNSIENIRKEAIVAHYSFEKLSSDYIRYINNGDKNKAASLFDPTENDTDKINETINNHIQLKFSIGKYNNFSELSSCDIDINGNEYYYTYIRRDNDGTGAYVVYIKDQKTWYMATNEWNRGKTSNNCTYGR